MFSLQSQEGDCLKERAAADDDAHDELATTGAWTDPQADHNQDAWGFLAVLVVVGGLNAAVVVVKEEGSSTASDVVDTAEEDAHNLQ